MKITLNRRVNLEKFSVVMEVGKFEERQEFIAYLLLTENRDGYLYAEDVCKHLLDDADINIGKRVVELCKGFHLIDENNRITPNGEQAIKTKGIYTPERGVYDIIVTNDLLYPQILVDLNDSQKSDLQRESRQINRNIETNKAEFSNSKAIPNYLRSIINKEFVLPTTGQKIRIFDIEGNCVNQNLNRREELFLEVKIDEFSPPMKQFNGLFNEKTGLAEITNFNFNSIWESILGEQKNNWRENENGQFKYLVHFASLQDHEKKNWVTTKNFSNIEISTTGRFRTVKTENVPLFPKTQEDAQEWAEYLLWDEINDYSQNQDLRMKWDLITTKFYPRKIKTHTAQELLSEKFPNAKNKNEKFWYLQTPIDLSI